MLNELDRANRSLPCYILCHVRILYNEQADKVNFHTAWENTFLGDTKIRNIYCQMASNGDFSKVIGVSNPIETFIGNYSDKIFCVLH